MLTGFIAVHAVFWVAGAENACHELSRPHCVSTSITFGGFSWFESLSMLLYVASLIYPTDFTVSGLLYLDSKSKGF